MAGPRVADPELLDGETFQPRATNWLILSSASVLWNGRGSPSRRGSPFTRRRRALVDPLERRADAQDRQASIEVFGSTKVTSNLFDVTFVDPKTSMLAWTLLGVGAALQRIDARERTSGA